MAKVHKIKNSIKPSGCTLDYYELACGRYAVENDALRVTTNDDDVTCRYCLKAMERRRDG